MNGNLTRNPVVIALSALAVIVLLSMSVSIVRETQQAIISSYGKPLRVVNKYHPNQAFGRTRAGLTFRIPFLEQIQIIDKRALGVEMERQEVLSTDQQRLQVDAFARFRVSDPVRMYRTIRTEEALRGQLRNLLGSSLRDQLGKQTFATLLSPERSTVMNNIQASLERQAKKYGAEIIDVQIKRADLPEGSPLESAYNRMKSARNQEAIAIDAEGRKEQRIIIAEANAQAAKIYADSFGKDPQFYDFYRALQSYQVTFEQGKGDTNLILSDDNAYLEKFKNGR